MKVWSSWVFTTHFFQWLSWVFATYESKKESGATQDSGSHSSVLQASFHYCSPLLQTSFRRRESAKCESGALQDSGTGPRSEQSLTLVGRQRIATHCSCHTHCECSRTAMHCNTLQHTATYCSTLQRTAAHCSALQHTAAHCSTPQLMTPTHTKQGFSSG